MKKITLFVHLMILSIFGANAQTNHNVSLISMTFSPANLTINIGDTVTWTNNSSIAHNVISGSNCTSDGNFSSATLNQNGTFSHKFTSVGTYNYFCSFHCAMGMTGTITVTGTTGVLNASTLVLETIVFPNPFTQDPTIQFNLNEPGNIKAVVYDMMGKKLNETSEVSASSGEQSILIPTENLNTGMYICKLFYNGSPTASEYIVKSTK